MKFYLPIYFALMMWVSQKTNAQILCDSVGTSTYSILMPNDTTDIRSFSLLDGLVASNGEYIAIGLLNDGGKSDPFFIRLDMAGNMLAVPIRLKFNSGSGELFFLGAYDHTQRKTLHIIEVYQSGTSIGYAIAGTAIFNQGGMPHQIVAKLNHNGAVQWSRISDNEQTILDFAAVDLLQRTDNGNLVVLTAYEDKFFTPHRLHMFFTELSILGNWKNEVLFKNYTHVDATIDNFYPTAITQYQVGSASNFIVAGSYEDAGGEQTIGIYMLDSLLESIYPSFPKINIDPNSTAEQPIPHAVAVNGTQIVLVGENRLNNGNGDLEGFVLNTTFPDVSGVIGINWAKRYWAGSTNLGILKGHCFFDLKINNAGDLLIAAHSLNGTASAFPYILKCGADGNLLWANNLNILYGNTELLNAVPHTLGLTQDGGMFVGGTVTIQGNLPRMFALKTDSLGKLENCDCYNPYLPPVTDYSPTVVTIDSVVRVPEHIGVSNTTSQISDLPLLMAYCDQQVPTIPGDSCCTDLASFYQDFAQGFTAQRYDCGLMLTPNSLDDCQNIWVDWGDGSTSHSTNGSQPLSHNYSAAGDYEVCLAAWAMGISGDTCAFRDTCWTVCLSCDACSNPHITSKWSRFPASSPLLNNGSNSHFFISPADKNGNLYVTGSFRGAFQGSGLDNSTATDDGFVAKYDATGNLLNGTFPPFSFGSNDGNDVGTVIKDDGGDGFFLAGMYAQSFQLPSPGNPSQAMTLPDEQNDVLIHANGFLAHYTESMTGQILDWVISVDGVDVQLNAISVISPNEAVFTGLFNNTTKLALHDSSHNGMSLHTIPGGSGAFVAKFNRLTNNIWVSTFDSTAHGLGVAVHKNAIYVAGDFYPPGINFNNGGTLIESTLVNSSNPTPFVAKLDDNLDLVRSFAIQDPGKLNTGSAWDIEANDNGVYVIGSYADNVVGVDFDPYNCGTFNGNIPDGGGNFLARYNADGCLEKWTKAPYPTGFYELELGSDNKVYVSGNKGGATMFLGIYDKDCQFLKSIEPQSSSGNLTQVWSITPLPYSNDFAVIGRFSGHQFDVDPMANNGIEFSGLPATDSATIFIGKYSCVCPNPTPESCCENLNVVVNGGSGCCYVVDLINNAGFGITKVEAVLINSDWGFVNVTPGNGFLETHTTHNITLTFPTIYSGDIGTHALQFCLDDLNSNATGSQSIIFTWYETRADGTERAICMDTVYMDCIPNTCCTDYQAFMDRVNAGFDFNFNAADCSISVTPNSLDSCQQVISWTWGDGNTSTGPFPSSISVNYHYEYDSDFTVCMTVAEYLPNADSCWNATFCDTISVNCSPACQCSGFSNVTVSAGGSTPLALTCGGTASIACPVGGLNFSTNFACNLSSCVPANMTWWLHKPFTTPLFGNISGGGFTVPEILLQGPGTYNLTLTGVCAGDSCTCMNQLVILEDCDTCLVDSLIVRTGYDYSSGLTYTIGALDPNWRWNDANVASYENCKTVLPLPNTPFKPAFSGTEYIANNWPTQHGYFDTKFKFCLPDSFDCQQLHFDLDVRAFPSAEFRINGYPIPTSFIDSAVKSAHINYPDKNWSYTPSAADCAYFKPGANIVNLRMKKYRSDPLFNISGTITQTGGQPILVDGDCCEWPEDDECNCEKFSQEVAGGFMQGGIVLSQLCRRSFKPIALQHCDLVEWTVDATVVANTTANYPFSYVFTNGIHEVCMNVTRVTNTGSTCTDSYCQNVSVNCSFVSPPVPPIAPHNFGFDSNSTEGILGQLGKTDFWQPSTGEPYLKKEPGCFDDWDLILSSNLTQKDAVHQEVVLSQGNTYKPEMYASNYYPLKDYFIMPRILLLASKTYQDAIEGCTQDCEIIGEYDQLLPTGEWQHIEWPNWTPSETYNYLTVMLEYPVDDDGTDESRCFVVVDNISLDIVNGSNEVEIGGIRLYPNPTSGHFSLYFNKPTSSNASLKIMGLRGEVLKTYTLSIGKIQHDFSIAELPAGAYFLKMEGQDGRIWTDKIVKQ